MITKRIPRFLKPVLRPMYYKLPKRIRRIFHPPLSREKVLEYWKNPWDGVNSPYEYLQGEERSQFLVEVVKKYAQPNWSICELGCNVGRNLNYLYLAGFKNLYGVEISEAAVELLYKTHPEMASHVSIYNASIEEVIQSFENNQFDLVFTMAVLEHIHPDSEWIFQHIVRITKNLITIEDEEQVSERNFPRNYQKTFQRLGMRQVEALNCVKVAGLGPTFWMRVFEK